MAFFAAMLRMLGPAGVAAVLVLAYYEGVPGVNALPFVDRFPFLREFGVGRVELERRAATSGLVRQAELDALREVLLQERAKTEAAEAMATEERNRAQAAQRAKDVQSQEIDRLRREASETPGLTYPSQEDLKWRATSR